MVAPSSFSPSRSASLASPGFDLAPRHRRVLRAFGEALFAHAAGPSDAQLDRLVERMRGHLEPVSRMQRTMLLLALDLVRWLPLLLFVSWRTFEGLPLAGRERLLYRMDRSRVMLLLLPLIAFKTVLCMHFFEDDAELRALGYPGDERKRWLTIAH
jgi:hypothetical protein